MNRRQRGQAMLELALSMPILAFLLYWGIPLVHYALQEKQQGRQLAQLALYQAEPRATFALPKMDMPYWNDVLGLRLSLTKWTVLFHHRDYAFAYATAPLDIVAGYQGSLGMSNNNLWEVEMAEYGRFDWLRYQRLANDWSPNAAEQLTQRPAALTSAALLDNSLLNTLQSVLGSLPLARELRPSELRFGYVDDHVVPAQALFLPARREEEATCVAGC